MCGGLARSESRGGGARSEGRAVLDIDARAVDEQSPICFLALLVANTVHSSLRLFHSYWRNYFEATDGLVWVVDSADRVRLNDCKRELHDLMGQEKLAGASLMIFANKQDLAGALTADEVRGERMMCGGRG